VGRKWLVPRWTHVAWRLSSRGMHDGPDLPRRQPGQHPHLVCYCIPESQQAVQQLKCTHVSRRPGHSRRCRRGDHQRHHRHEWIRHFRTRQLEHVGRGQLCSRGLHGSRNQNSQGVHTSCTLPLGRQRRRNRHLRLRLLPQLIVNNTD